MVEPEEMLHFVGRLQAVHDAIQSAISKIPDNDMHSLDLLVVAREATHRALIAIWGKAPSFPEQRSGD